MKKALSILLAVCLLIGCLPLSASAAENGGPSADSAWTDLTVSDWNANITRIQVAELAVDLFETATHSTISTENAPTFNDVSGAELETAQKAYTIQAMFGYESGTFGPANSMTRAELAAICYRLLCTLGFDRFPKLTPMPSDVPTGSSYYTAVSAILGVIGVPCEEFKPNTACDCSLAYTLMDFAYARTQLPSILRYSTAPYMDIFAGSPTEENPDGGEEVVITRLQVAELLVALHEDISGEEIEPANKTFKDCDDIIAKKAYKAFDMGWETPYFRPDEPMPRYELAHHLCAILTDLGRGFISNVTPWVSPDTVSFEDVDSQCVYYNDILALCETIGYGKESESVLYGPFEDTTGYTAYVFSQAVKRNLPPAHLNLDMGITLKFQDGVTEDIKLTPMEERFGSQYLMAPDLPVPTRDSYKFMGWNTKADGSGATITASRNDTWYWNPLGLWVIVPDSTSYSEYRYHNITGLYAQWQKIVTPLSSNMVASIPNQPYTGSAITPEPVVTVNGGTLTKGTDYTVAYENNTNVGTATVKITGQDFYSGTVTKTFTITKYGLTDSSVTNISAQTYTGSAITPEPVVTANGSALTKGTDYTVSYSGNTNAGTATVTVTGMGNYSGTVRKTFTISPKALTNAMIGAIGTVTYTGSAQTPALTVTDGKALVKGADYTVEYTNNTNAGTATATITGKGNYTGTASANFTIQPKDISDLTVTVTGTPEVDQALLATVSGAETSGLTYAWTADGSAVAGQTKPYLILTSAYENKEIAAAVTGSGNYTGTVTSQTVTVGAPTNESTSVAVPAKPEVSANSGNRQISVSVTVSTEETDKPVCLYELQLYDSNGTLIETYYSLTNSYTITGLVNGTAYQVKAIAYNVNGASAQSDAATATPKAPAPIGGGGSSTPVTPDPVITENPDGSQTTTETAEDGTTTATTTWDDGKQAVAVKSRDGEKTITVTTAQGEKVADVNIPAAPAAGKEFEDVKSGSWYESAVDTATGYGLFNGTSETKFSPDDGMTRGMLATVLYNLSGKPEYGTDAGAFNDVETGKWYEDPVDWAYKVGVTSGTSETEFSPNQDITREQLVTMLYRYAEKIGAASSNRNAITGFPDGNNVAGYAKDAMQWAVAEGFISGRAQGGKNYIAPQGTASRAEVAAVLTRFVKYLAK